MAAFVCFRQKISVIAIRRWTIAKPPDAAVWHELMHAALKVESEGVPRKQRSLMELSIGTVQQLDIVRIRVPLRPRLSINDVCEDLLARCVTGNFV